MMDYTGVTTYPAGESTEKRKADSGRANPGSASATSPFQIYQAPRHDYSTFQFREPLTPPRLEIPQSQTPQITLLGLLPANMAQLVNRNLEKIAGQVMSFFKGNPKEKPSEEERLRRQLNDAFGTGLSGETIRVPEAAKGQMDDSGDR